MSKKSVAVTVALTVLLTAVFFNETALSQRVPPEDDTTEGTAAAIALINQADMYPAAYVRAEEMDAALDTTDDLAWDRNYEIVTSFGNATRTRPGTRAQMTSNSKRALRPRRSLNTKPQAPTSKKAKKPAPSACRT